MKINVMSRANNGNLMVVFVEGKTSITRHLNKYPGGGYRDADGHQYVMTGAGEVKPAGEEGEE